jgi:hypothetical protein
MALTRAEINRRYRLRHPKRYQESIRQANEKRRQRLLKQIEIEALNEVLCEESENE